MIILVRVITVCSENYLLSDICFISVEPINPILARNMSPIRRENLINKQYVYGLFSVTKRFSVNISRGKSVK